MFLFMRSCSWLSPTPSSTSTSTFSWAKWCCRISITTFRSSNKRSHILLEVFYQKYLHYALMISHDLIHFLIYLVFLSFFLNRRNISFLLPQSCWSGSRKNADVWPSLFPYKYFWLNSISFVNLYISCIFFKFDIYNAYKINKNSIIYSL